MDALMVLCAVLIFVVVYILFRRVTGPAERDVRRRADENAQELLERHRKQNEENLDRDEEYQQAGFRCERSTTVSPVLGDRSEYAYQPDLAHIGDQPERAVEMIVDASGMQPSIVFAPVPEAKTAKKRLHLDIRADKNPKLVADLIDAGGIVLTERRIKTKFTS